MVEELIGEGSAGQQIGRDEDASSAPEQGLRACLHALKPAPYFVECAIQLGTHACAGAHGACYLGLPLPFVTLRKPY